MMNDEPKFDGWTAREILESDARYRELENWRAARIVQLTAEFNAGKITEAEFLHDVRQALI